MGSLAVCLTQTLVGQLVALEMIQFDYRIFFDWVVQSPPRYLRSTPHPGCQSPPGIITFLVGNPELNLHLPLESWVGGRSNRYPFMKFLTSHRFRCFRGEFSGVTGLPLNRVLGPGISECWGQASIIVAMVIVFVP